MEKEHLISEKVRVHLLHPLSYATADVEVLVGMIIMTTILRGIIETKISDLNLIWCNRLKKYNTHCLKLVKSIFFDEYTEKMW